MTQFSKAMRDFLASMPVIGPHSMIECELLLAGKKPVGFLPVLREDQIDDDWTDRKYVRDVKLLDKAVAEGKLKSVDLFLTASGSRILRHYCQPNRIQDMQRVYSVNRKIYGKGHCAHYMGKDYAARLGYSKKDETYFRLYNMLPQNFLIAVHEASWPVFQARREELLAECGIDHDDWIRQLQAENIIT